jgi:large subunit ribosomal protein L10
LAISKERKERLVAEYKDLLKKSTALIMTSYSGISVKELEGLRRKVREAGGVFHIVKNNLVERAFTDEGVPLPEGGLVGPTAIGFTEEDILGVAKAIVELSRETEYLSVKAAVIDGVVYDGGQVRQLAELPPLPVVQAQLLSILQTPGSRIAGLFAGSLRGLMSVFKAYAESEGNAA